VSGTYDATFTKVWYYKNIVLTLSKKSYVFIFNKYRHILPRWIQQEFLQDVNKRD
jgi:hypothetical protein